MEREPQSDRTEENKVRYLLKEFPELERAISKDENSGIALLCLYYWREYDGLKMLTSPRHIIRTWRRIKIMQDEENTENILTSEYITQISAILGQSGKYGMTFKELADEINMKKDVLYELLKIAVEREEVIAIFDNTSREARFFNRYYEDELKNVYPDHKRLIGKELRRYTNVRE